MMKRKGFFERAIVCSDNGCGSIPKVTQKARQDKKLTKKEKIELGEILKKVDAI